MHGATIDATTTAETAAIIAAAFEHQNADEYWREKGAILLDGTGAGNTLLKVSSQYDWLLERVTLTGVNALVSIYENQVAGADLLEVVQIGAVGLYSDSFSNILWVPANSQVVISVSGGPSNGQMTFNLQIKLKPHRRRK